MLEFEEYKARLNAVKPDLDVLRGALLCFVAFALLPLVQAMVPLEEVNRLINESTLAPMFNSTNLILSIMNGRL